MSVCERERERERVCVYVLLNLCIDHICLYACVCVRVCLCVYSCGCDGIVHEMCEIHGREISIYVGKRDEKTKREVEELC